MGQSGNIHSQFWLQIFMTDKTVLNNLASSRLKKKCYCNHFKCSFCLFKVSPLISITNTNAHFVLDTYKCPKKNCCKICLRNRKRKGGGELGRIIKKEKGNVEWLMVLWEKIRLWKER